MVLTPQEAALKMHTEPNTMFLVTATVRVFFMSFHTFAYTANATPALKPRKNSWTPFFISPQFLWKPENPFVLSLVSEYLSFYELQLYLVLLI